MAASYRSALVTGASSGIGVAFAKSLAARGCDLVLVARRADRMQALARDLAGVAVEVLPADLATDDGVRLVEERLADDPVELLVNNAGVGIDGRFEAQSVDEATDVVRVNVIALLRLTHAALGPMMRAGHGGILNVSSLAGDQPLRGFATYAASKSFVSTFTESLAAEARAAGVHVTLVKPGYVYTEMTEQTAPDPKSLVGRFWLQPEDVASAALDAVEHGRVTCVPGLPWRALSTVVQSIPHPVVRAVTSRFDASG
ncbi:MAG TPA: SDR family oxidoreductase [Mycobacteriales bacterium]|nr:SDR family oxidoreductase [Mycobacteriales bacterium]